MAPNAQLLRRAEARLREDTDFAAVLETLLDAPAASHGRYRSTAAAALNDLRRRDAVAAFVDGALATSQVQELLSLGTPQAVHQLRSRGRLIGLQHGNATWFPAWQLSGGSIRDDLPEILAALRRFSGDPIALDRVMRLERDELKDRSIAEALDDPGTAPMAWIVLRKLGD